MKKHCHAALLLAVMVVLPVLQLDAQENKQEDYSWVHHNLCIENIAYGEDEDQRLDIYLQGNWIGPPAYFEADSSLRPTIVFFHGGGWISGQKEHFLYESFFLNFLKCGWNVVNVEYRLGENTAPEAVDDALCAISWISEHSEDYHIDSKKIVLYGVSAGGHLALIAGLMNTVPESHPCAIGDEINIGAIINWFGVSDIRKHYDYKIEKGLENTVLIWVGSHDEVDEISEMYSPVKYVTKSTPPVISIHGDVDGTVLYSHSETLHELLDELNVRNQLVTIENGRHMGFTRNQFQFAYEQIFLFLEEVME